MQIPILHQRSPGLTATFVNGLKESLASPDIYKEVAKLLGPF